LQEIEAMKLSEIEIPEPVPVEVQDGDIVIYPGDMREYCIESDRIDTPEKCLAWVLHLSAKNWVDHRLLCTVAELAASSHGFKIPWGC
jgi:hypothetical protein